MHYLVELEKTEAEVAAVFRKSSTWSPVGTGFRHDNRTNQYGNIVVSVAVNGAGARISIKDNDAAAVAMNVGAVAYLLAYHFPLARFTAY